MRNVPGQPHYKARSQNIIDMVFGYCCSLSESYCSKCGRTIKEEECNVCKDTNHVFTGSICPKYETPISDVGVKKYRNNTYLAEPMAKRGGC